MIHPVSLPLTAGSESSRRVKSPVCCCLSLTLRNDPSPSSSTERKAIEVPSYVKADTDTLNTKHQT